MGHRRTLAKVSIGVMIDLTNQGKTWETICFKLIVLLKKIVYENHLLIMFGCSLTFDAVYTSVLYEAVKNIIRFFTCPRYDTEIS